ncbi:hypothetical protein HPU229334_11365 [Helicobacter pullorum]|uniref:Uncharacterized protein n=2 Tax=Helicobacter pullorum TaxID=35818 RepID=A0A0N0LT63_9HELI|nr:hypothetical protein HPU229334_11365 [Helicobacter pullorum]
MLVCDFSPKNTFKISCCSFVRVLVLIAFKFSFACCKCVFSILFIKCPACAIRPFWLCIIFIGSRALRIGYLAVVASQPFAKVSASSLLSVSFSCGLSFMTLKPCDTALLPTAPPKNPSANLLGSKPTIFPFSSVSIPATLPLTNPAPMWALLCIFSAFVV